MKFKDIPVQYTNIVLPLPGTSKTFMVKHLWLIFSGSTFIYLFLIFLLPFQRFQKPDTRQLTIKKHKTNINRLKTTQKQDIPEDKITVKIASLKVERAKLTLKVPQPRSNHSEGPLPGPHQWSFWSGTCRRPSLVDLQGHKEQVTVIKPRCGQGMSNCSMIPLI